jgi:hypothetical protein
VPVNGCPPIAAACRLASAGREVVRSLPAIVDRAFLVRAVAWSIATFLAFGLVAAIIPNPVFGRSVPPEPFAIAIWILSAPLMGLVAATYGPRAGAMPGPAAAPILLQPASASAEGRGTTTATIGGMAAFIAIGCPVCNKVALVLLGASGALTVFAPLQPYIGAASLGLLAITLGWRLHMLSNGGACRVPAGG